MSYGAIFSRRNCRIYNLSTDATLFSLAQAIDGVGALAARAICTYGAEDLFFLDETGIRSLKARDALTTANVNDIGVAIDTFIRAQIDATPYSVVQRAVAIIDEALTFHLPPDVDRRIYALCRSKGLCIIAGARCRGSGSSPRPSGWPE